MLALLVAGLMTIDARIVLARQQQLGHLELGHDHGGRPRREPRRGALGSTGSQDPSRLPRRVQLRPAAEPARPLPALRIPSLRLVDDDTCVPVVSFLAGPATPRVGLWVFYAARADEEAAAGAALAAVRGAVDEPLPHYLVVRSTGAQRRARS